MQKLFISLAVLLGILAGISGYWYCYYVTYFPSNLTYRFALKPIPTTLISTLVFSCFIIYGLKLYTCLIEIGIMFCLIGDILLMLYLPEVSQISGYKHIQFILAGGSSFFLARVCFTLSYLLLRKPYMRKNYIKPSLYKAMGCLAFPLFFTVSVGVYFIGTTEGVIKYLLPGYILMMGVQAYISVLRIGHPNEYLTSQILGSIGAHLFFISDTILFYNVFVETIKYLDIISISIYWLSLYLMSLSVVR